MNCGPDWDWNIIEQAVDRGPHQSALDTEHVTTVKEEIIYQVEAGFLHIIPWEEVKILNPKKLKVSPMVVIPQKDRQGRIVLDLSFPV